MYKSKRKNMKPRIFIGSSVEGLNIAYSIQQNLTHDAEVTVWDQGVFELSKTTIESLVEKLDDSDFGIFVFSGDDITTIRDTTKTTVRDNVLFEFGLFIGKLSRERVFFITPSNTDLHLPTDLLGITPGKFEANRDDGSLQAATGPVSNQIRQQIKKLGKRAENEDIGKYPDEKEGLNSKENDWISDLISRKFDNAKKKLRALNKSEKDENTKIENEIFIAYCNFKENEIEGEKELEKLLKKYSDKLIANKRISQFYLAEDYYDRAIEILENALIKFKNDSELAAIQSDCINKTEGFEKAVEFLQKFNPEIEPIIAIKLSKLYEENDDLFEARNVIHKIYTKYPNNEDDKYKYARTALDLNKNEIALFLLKSLTLEYPENYSYWGYLSNCAVNLDFTDLALRACNKAEELTESSEEWILSNTGNILKNCGLYTEGIKYLEKGLEINKNSDYAHDRLSIAIKKREEENKKIEAKRKEGRKMLRDFGKE
jgi:predicted Zn-dependent protease